MEHVSCGFSILLKADEVLRVFGTHFRISRLASVPQKSRRNRLIYDSMAPPPGGDCLLPPHNRHKLPYLPPTLPVNASTDASSAPFSMKFCACLPHLLQYIWEANAENGPLLPYKCDIPDGFHRCVLWTSDVGSFTYVVPPILGDTEIYICVDLFLPLGWVNSPPLFCSTSETDADLANAYLANPEIPWRSYAPKKAFIQQPPTTLLLPTAFKRLRYIWTTLWG